MNQVKTIDKQAVSDKINQKSKELKYKLGSALSYNSFATLISPEYPIAFVGLNPGGDEYDKPSIESDNGKCAYYYENWTAKGENKKHRRMRRNLIRCNSRLSNCIRGSLKFSVVTIKR